MRPTIDLEDAVGKRLDAVISDYSGMLLLVFEGGDPVVLEADTSWDDEPTIEEKELHLSQWINHAKELIEHGVITQDEVDKELDRQRQDLLKRLDWKRKEVEHLERQVSSQTRQES